MAVEIWGFTVGFGCDEAVEGGSAASVASKRIKDGHKPVTKE